LAKRRLQVELTEDEYKLLEKLAGDRSISELVRKALNTEAYLQDAESDNAKVLIERPDGSVRELARV
jgi:hypothetical protein